MKNRVNSCHTTTIDDSHRIGDKLDHHAVTPPGYSSLPTHSPQRSKMPALLLRLDSVGEVSTVKLPSDSTASGNLTKVSSKPALHISKSFDSDIASKTAQRWSPAMAKLLCQNKAPYGNSHRMGSVLNESFNLSSKSTLESDAFYGVKNLSSSFDSCEKNSLLHNMKTMMGEYNLSRSPGQQTSTFQPAVSLYSTMLSHAAACHMSPSSVSAPLQVLSPLKKDIFSFVTSSPKVPMVNVSHQRLNNISLSSSSVDTSTSDQSLSVVFQSGNEAGESEVKCDNIKAGESEVKCDNIKAGESGVKCDNINAGERQLATTFVFNGELEPPSSVSDCKPAEESSSSCDKFICDSSQNSTSGNSSSASLRPAADLSSILSTPRKTTKKGRPSSKKQRKRQREKQKINPAPSVPETFSSPETTEKGLHLSDIKQSKDGECLPEMFKVSCTQKQPESTPKQSTPVKTKTKYCPIASFFFGGKSDSEETDGCDDDDGDGSDEDSSWSVSEDAKMPCPPESCTGFNTPLNLDSIFKSKSVPSLKSILLADDSESESETSSVSFNDSQSSAGETSQDETSLSSSVKTSPQSPLKSFGFTCGLSLEALFTKKPDFVCQEKGSASGTVGEAASSVDGCQLSSNLEMCSESISRINARWEENYPSAGFRSCRDISADEISNPNIKVHFASGPGFVTVHFVGTEERAGTWHHFSLDRERFQRRIRDLDNILNPILDAAHRARILLRNMD